MQNRSIQLLVFIALLALTPWAGATSVYSALAQLEDIVADDERRQASYDAGEERIRFCGYCHGRDGNSKRDYIPNLAAQHPLYLFEQFEKFGSGAREDYVMSQLAKTLTVEERINIAVYYSEQKAQPRPGADPRLAGKGGQFYDQRCAACHGQTAEGFRDMPRLAGQPAEYVTLALKRFQGMDPTKHRSPMIGISAVLSETDIQALAAYLQGL
ncbi:c-type cytochrome [Marinobacter shengliensis]|uniref:c-type cytochrome n=1 Tax=Marinobacter shengliensis TaxID=1389223 RepID=UPI002573B42C|nr:c-type cytochrome [Marinobacter shengliensis]BEH15274.1 cytochrome c [Marinobacter shengliensis]